MKNYKQRLHELNNNNKRKTQNASLQLFIAEAVAETNSNVKWLIWIAGIAATLGIGVLVALAARGL